MSLPLGEIAFVDNQVPPLVAGDYVVDLQQTVTGDGVAGDYRFDQSMQVLGPHFVLDAGSVHAVYPPGGSTADYTESVASVVLSRATLPWVIAPAGGQNESGPLVTPWLMLLLLTPEEIVRPGPNGAQATDTSPPTVSPTGAYTVSLATYLKPEAGTLGPAFTTQQVTEFETDYPADTTTLVIDVAASAFTAVAPTLAELGYLAHARDVDADDGELGDEVDDGFYSVVIGNRLARGSASGIYVAHLVSVEGFTTYLPPASLPSGTTKVRLVSMASWTFTGLPGAGNFAGLMANLDIGTPILPTSQPPAPSPAQQLIGAAAAEGYVAVDYQTRFGERTICWYRGPALPLLMAANPQPARTDSSQDLIYDPSTGMFDVSYAVAWETGRMLLLANRALTVSLLAWLRRQHKLARLVLDRLPRLSGSEEGERSVTLDRLTAPTLISDRALHLLAERLGQTQTGQDGWFGPPRDPTGLRGRSVRLPGLPAEQFRPAFWHTPDPTGETRPVEPDATTPAEPEGELSRLRRTAPALALRGLLTSPAARPLLDTVLEPLPEDITDWLARITLLAGLPFNTVVPDAGMLPTESIRFFHLDQNWVAALLDGALSVVELVEADNTLLELRRPTIHAQATRRAAQLRAHRIRRGRVARNARRMASGRRVSVAALRAETADPPPPPPMPWSGFVLRSAAVADWPGLTVTAYADSAGTQPLTVLRLDRVAPTVLIGIAGGIVQRVRIAKPPTALHFGVVHQDAEQSPTSTACDLVYLRGVGGRYPAGPQLPNDPYVVVHLRPDGQGRAVVDIATLQSDLSSHLVAAYQPDSVPQTPPVPSGAFGLQFVATAEAELFVAGATR